MLVAGGQNSAFAQRWPFELWHEGKIVLLEGDTLKGLVKYDLQQTWCSIAWPIKRPKPSRPAKCFTSRSSIRQCAAIASFCIALYNPFAIQGTRFFELLEEGKMTLLAREALEYRTYNSMYYMGGAYSRQVLVYKYFLLEENGNIAEFTGNKNDLLDLMGKSLKRSRSM